MNEVVTLSADQAGDAQRVDSRDLAQAAPRIVQHLDPHAAERLLILCGARSRPVLPVVVLDNYGLHWSLEPIPDTSPIEAERGRVIWRRLWVPPLPGGGEHG